MIYYFKLISKTAYSENNKCFEISRTKFNLHVIKIKNLTIHEIVTVMHMVNQTYSVKRPFRLKF